MHKIQEILLSGLEELLLQIISVVYLILAKFHWFKRGVTWQQQKSESEFPANMHLYTLCTSSLQIFTIFW